MKTLNQLARKILELTCYEDHSGVWCPHHTFFPNAEAEIEAILQWWLNENLPDPREVLLSDEFLRKFAAAFADTPIPCHLETLDPTRVEDGTDFFTTSTEDFDALN